MTPRPWLLALLAMTSCAELERLQPGTCGNRVVEPENGEECDSRADPALGDDLQCGPPDGSAQQCRYLCDGAECPVGWACEDDGICRPASGTFEVPDSAQAIVTADEIVLADLSGDERAELIAWAGGDVSIFVNDDDEGYLRSSELSLSNLRGMISTADIDQDEYLELLVPVASSFADPMAVPRVHVLRDDGERLQTALSPQTTISALRGAWPEAERALTAARVRPGSDSAVEVVAVVAEGPDALFTYVPESSCVILPESARVEVWPQTFAQAQVVPVERDATALTPATLALPIVGQTRVPIVTWERSCGAVLCEPSSALEIPCVTTPTLAASVELPRPLIAPGCTFWDTDDDGRDDLLCHTEGQEILVALASDEGFELPVSMTAALDSRHDLPDTQSRACNGGHELLATGDLDGNGSIDFVTPHAIFLADGTGYIRAHARDRGDAWGEVVLGDFDGDGAMEVVASVLDVELDCRARQLEHLVPTLGSFLPKIVPASAPPLQIRTGDFDGDGLDDLAVVERSEAGDIAVSVSFGDIKEALEDRATTATFGSIDALVPARTRDGTAFNEDLIEDLVILSDGGEQWTLVTGTPSRTLLAPLELPTAPGPSAGATTLATFAGPLRGSEDELDAPDLAAFAEGHAWLFRDEDVHHGDEVVHWRGDALPDALASFRTPCARWAMHIPSEETAAATMIAAIDGVSFPEGLSDSCELESTLPRLIVASFIDGAEVELVATALTVPPELRLPTSIAVFDFGVPGQGPDLVVRATVDGTLRGAAFLWSDIALESGSSTAAINLLPDEDVLAIVPLNADRDRHLELAALTMRGLFILDRLESEDQDIIVSEVLAPLPEPRITGDTVTLIAGEVDGDGLDDLVLLFGRSLYVYPSQGED